MKRSYAVSTVALFLSACGGGGDDSPGVAVNPPTAVSPSPPAPAAPPAAPTPTAPPPQVIAVPAPVTPPVDPNSPAQSPATPPPQPAEGTYVLGRVVKDAILAQRFQEFQANEIDPVNDQPKADGLKVVVNFYTRNTEFSQYSYPVGQRTGTLPKYPYGGVTFPVGFSDAGFFTLGRTIQGYTYLNGQSKNTPMIRVGGDFEIKDDFKFIIDTTSAEWRGVEVDRAAFVQLQISSFAQSNTVFKLCLHESFGDVRRLACTLHNKDTGVLRGSQVIDDSRNIGQIEYRPVQ